MSLTSYRAAPPRVMSRGLCLRSGFIGIVLRELWLLTRFGGDLLSHVLRRSTIGVLALNGRVRDGIGCLANAMTTKPRKKPSVQVKYQEKLAYRGCGHRRFAGGERSFY